MSTDPEMVRQHPAIHAAVIDSLHKQLMEAEKRIDKLIAELGEERQMNGILHTERDHWKSIVEQTSNEPLG